MVDPASGHAVRGDVLVANIDSEKGYFVAVGDLGSVNPMLVIRSVQLDWQSVLSLALVVGFFVLAVAL